MKNVVMIFCDELRQDALGCYGNAAGPMRTPHMDSIAASGVLFENCFCNSPVCVPSRTSLLTGLYPEETGVYDNEAAYSGFVMPRRPVTFPEVLRSAGYRTASFGKTHLPPQLAPFALDDPEGGEMHMGLSPQERRSLDKISPRGAFSFNAASLYPAGRDYYPEAVTRNALRWMEEQEGPYFVRLSYTQPHTPIIVKRGYEDKYRDVPFSGALPDTGGLSEFERAFADAVGLDTMTEEELIQAKRYYYGMVCWIDDEVGKVLAFLRRKGLLEQTVLLVSADHGALRGECRGLGKHIFNRASQAVPLIISDPAGPRGERRSELCSNIDIPRTLLALLGVEAPGGFRGADLFAPRPPETVFATIGYGEPDSRAFPNRQLGTLPGGRGWPRRACIRKEHYRLDMNVRIDGAAVKEGEEDVFFVDCARCPGEDVNMVSEYPAVAAAMAEELRAHCRGAVEADPGTLKVPQAVVRAER